jgi:hypothetical protein
MDLQKLVDAISATGRKERGRYHLTLGKAIALLEEIDSTTPMADPIGEVESYRGYYSDLSFDVMSAAPKTAGQVLADLRAALGATFEGYKGGDFVMDSDTPLWVSAYGSASGDAVMDFTVSDGRVHVVVRNID